MNLKPLILTTLLSATLGVLIFSPQSSKAQPGQFCAVGGNYEPASETNRTVELPEFGISVEIPSNYRAMQHQDGSVEVVHPQVFEHLQCLAQGGGGGHGYYSERIQAVTPDRSMSLREQARWAMGSKLDRNGDLVPSATGVIDYQYSNLNGYIVTSVSGFAVTFLGYIPGQNQLFQITARCDCSVEIEKLTDFLEGVKPLSGGINIQQSGTLQAGDTVMSSDDSLFDVYNFSGSAG